MKYFRVLLPVTVINVLVLFAIMFKLPEVVPTHVNAWGVIDGYGPRWVTPVFGLIPLVLLLLMEFYRKKNIKNEKVQKNRKVESILWPVLTLFFVGISWLPVILSYMEKSVLKLPMELITGVPIGLLMIILGNYMGVIKQNRYLGIRTPWTLRNELVWQKTHRMGAYYMVIGGAILVVGSIISYLKSNPFVGLISIIISISLIVIVPTVYSYIIYTKIEKQNK